MFKPPRSSPTQPLPHLLAHTRLQLGHPAVERRGERVLHLHGFEHEDRIALLQLRAGFRGDRDDLAGHGRQDRAVGDGEFAAFGFAGIEDEFVGLAAIEDDDAVASRFGPTDIASLSERNREMLVLVLKEN
jgi:hypothetical protein